MADNDIFPKRKAGQDRIGIVSRNHELGEITPDAIYHVLIGVLEEIEVGGYHSSRRIRAGEAWYDEDTFQKYKETPQILLNAIFTGEKENEPHIGQKANLYFRTLVSETGNDVNEITINVASFAFERTKNTEDETNKPLYSLAITVNSATGLDKSFRGFHDRLSTLVETYTAKESTE